MGVSHNKMKIYLIDGNGYLHRAYHAIKNLTTSKGEQVNAVFGFTKMLLKILREYEPDYIAVCFDHPAATFRKKEFPQYKANRKETDEELKGQFSLTRQVLDAMNINSFEKEGFEADDLLATISLKASASGIETVIVTGDKDILQLVDDKVKVLNEPQNMLYGIEEVLKKWGVPPEKMADYLGLTGDSSDNIPGLPGVGDKTALKLLTQYGSVEEVIKNKQSIEGKVGEIVRANYSSAVFSKKLVTLLMDVPVEVDFEKLKPQKPDAGKIMEIIKRLEFYSLANSLLDNAVGGDKKTDYKIIDTEEKLIELSQDIKEKGYFSFFAVTDTEKSFFAIAISVAKGEGFYVHSESSGIFGVNGQKINLITKYLRPLFEDETIIKISHDVKSQFGILERFGVFTPDWKILKSGEIFDTAMASYLLNPSKKNHLLEEIMLEHLGVQKDISNIESLLPDQDAAAGCVAGISDLILQLSDALTGKLKEKGVFSLFNDVEMPLLKLLFMMERSGILIDREYFEGLAVKYAGILKKYEEEIYSAVGEKFNINSSRQLAGILFEKLGMKPVKKTKTGYSTDEDVLIALSQNHELPRILLSYREVSKLKSTFVDALLEKINPKTGRLHTSFNQAGTSTGRLSSSEPNLQNIPVKTETGREIRRGFISEKNKILASFDYSQIDLRVLAHITGDKMLTDAFKNNEDIHTVTASEVFGLKKEEVTQEIRKRAKTINFGIVYGQQAWGLSQQIGTTVEEAQKYIDKYFEKYSGVKKWIEKIILHAKEKCFVTTLLGRLRYLPEINSKNGQMRSLSERLAVNTPIQGTSADIIKVAMVNVYNKLRLKGLNSRMLIQVHDELLFEIPETEYSVSAPLIKYEMENAVKLNIPVIVDVKSGNNWADLNGQKE